MPVTVPGPLAVGFAVLVIVVSLVLVAVSANGIWSARSVAVDGRRDIGAPARMAAPYVIDLAVPRLVQAGYRPAAAGSTTVLERRFHPWWTIVLAVCLFPLGLLALLIRGRHVVTITATGDTLHVTGRATPWARDILLGSLQRRRRPR